MALFMIRIVRITTKDETKMANSQIKKNDKVFVMFGEDKAQGVVVDICPASRWSSPLYLIMFKSNDNVHLSTWYDAYRVFRV